MTRHPISLLRPAIGSFPPGYGIPPPTSTPPAADSLPPGVAPTEPSTLLGDPDVLMPLFEWTGKDRIAETAAELGAIFGSETSFHRARHMVAAARREWKAPGHHLQLTISTYATARDALSAYVEPQADVPGAVTREFEGGAHAYFAPPEQGDAAQLWKGNFVVDLTMTAKAGAITPVAPPQAKKKDAADSIRRHDGVRSPDASTDPRADLWERIRDAMFRRLALRIPDTLVTVTLLVDGQEIPLTSPPLQIGDAMLVPLKPIFDYLGFEMKWNLRNAEVEATDGRTTLRLKLGSRLVSARARGNPIPRSFEIATAPFTFNEMTYVSLDFFAPALNLRAAWDASQRRLTLDRDPPRS